MHVGTTVVEMVDSATQSETEDLSDIESNAQQSSRKPSSLQVVPEEDHEDDELVNLAILLFLSTLQNREYLLANKPEPYTIFVFICV